MPYTIGGHFCTENRDKVCRADKESEKITTLLGLKSKINCKDNSI